MSRIAALADLPTKADTAIEQLKAAATEAAFQGETWRAFAARHDDRLEPLTDGEFRAVRDVWRSEWRSWTSGTSEDMGRELGPSSGRPRVYISGPLTSSGNINENIDHAIAAARRLIKAGLAPFVPHLSYHVDPGEEYPHSVWMEIDLPWLEAADVVLRLPGESVGVDIEVKHAEALGIPVFESIDRMVACFDARACPAKEELESC